ncbi:unnamed protein product [Citrullus colocynthis]|uniref:Spindle and kinetochore-associated protein 1 homolog n=1 Tax=Citrullus colocynthis TaxID=252529 RepID=A0ABP0XNR0_9ROSI
MDSKEAGSLLDNLIAAFNGRIAELQDLVIARNMYPASCLPDLSAVDASLKAMELQVQAIKNQLREEAEAIPKAKKLIEASLKQQKRLESISLHVPSYYQILPERVSALNLNTSLCSEAKKSGTEFGSREAESVISILPKEKKGSSSPLWYITTDELNSLSSYMRGRLTVDKVNAAVNDMATYAEANAQLIVVPKKKLAENLWEKALELRDIAATDAVKGKYFFLETDMRGPSLKLDNTGKAILTVLRHLGRISETRIGHQRSSLYERESTIYNSNNPFLKDSSSEAYISIVWRSLVHIILSTLPSTLLTLSLGVVLRTDNVDFLYHDLVNVQVVSSDVIFDLARLMDNVGFLWSFSTLLSCHAARPVTISFQPD